MAKSSSFFGLRKGSTKSLTFSILDGQQVTKDRVINVKNPQTVAQASQRYKLASLCNSWRMLAGICDHSFEGVAYGNKSRQKFMSLNLSGVDVLPVPKGSNVALPYNIYISKGSLNNPFILGGPAVPVVGLVDGQGITEAWVTAMLTAYPSLQRGDQITLYSVAGQSENFTFENVEYPTARFKTARIVLDPSSPVNVGFTYATASKQLTTSDGLTILIESMQISPALDVEPISVGSIISRQVNGSWLRSTSITKPEDLGEYADAFTDDYKDAAIASYAASAITAKSPLYLNQAEPNI
jgi:hypothetical protein